MEKQLIQQIRQIIKSARNSNELKDAVVSYCHDIGVQNFKFVSSMFNLASSYPELKTLDDYPAPWSEHYKASDYFDYDLTVKHSRCHSTPLIWLDAKMPLDETNERLFSEASQYGIVSGITYPYHGMGCEFGMFSASVAESFEKSPLNSIATQHSIYLLGATLFDLYNRRNQENLIKLTEREKECLRWTAEGKTSWEIAMILRISERTATFHLDNAKKKLNSLTRAGAVSKAIQLGLI